MRKGFVLFLVYFCIACLFSSLIIFVNPTPFIKLYILGIEKSADLDISFSSATSQLLDKWHFKDVAIKSGKGYGTNIEALTLDPSFRQLLEGKYKFKCSAQNIRLHGKWPILEGVAGLVSKEAGQDTIFKTVEATISVNKGHVKIFKLKAEAR